MYQVRLDCGFEHLNPEFEFETLEESNRFIEICFNNGYGVSFKKETDELLK